MTHTQQLPPGGVGELIDRQRVWCRETFAPIQIQDQCDELFKVQYTLHLSRPRSLSHYPPVTIPERQQHS